MLRLIIVILVALAASYPKSTSACVCFGFAKFEEAAARASVVITGKVTSASPSRKYDMEEHIAHVDVEVLTVHKGRDVPRRIRIWDSMVFTDCGGALEAVTVGDEIQFALELVTGSTSRDVWAITGINPSPGDYTVGSCGQYLKRLKPEPDADR